MDKGSHYLPHHAVVKEERKTTKVRIVGPNFIPKLFDILVRFRSNPVALVGDIEKAFLMIRIAKDDRDKLRFLWFDDPLKLDSDF